VDLALSPGRDRQPVGAGARGVRAPAARCMKMQWANQAQAYKLVEALKAIAERHGWDQRSARRRHEAGPADVALRILKVRLVERIAHLLGERGSRRAGRHAARPDRLAARRDEARRPGPAVGPRRSRPAGQGPGREAAGGGRAARAPSTIRPTGSTIARLRPEPVARRPIDGRVRLLRDRDSARRDRRGPAMSDFEVAADRHEGAPRGARGLCAQGERRARQAWSATPELMTIVAGERLCRPAVLRRADRGADSQCRAPVPSGQGGS
jgi:hypothetical protein